MGCMCQSVGQGGSADTYNCLQTLHYKFTSTVCVPPCGYLATWPHCFMTPPLTKRLCEGQWVH